MMFGFFSQVLQSVVAFDMHFNASVALMRTPFLDTVFLWVTLLGGTVLFVSIMCVFLLCASVYQRYAWIVPTILVAVGAPVTTYILKYWIARPRPDFALIVEPLYSFPSGHATTAMASFGLICFFLVRYTTKVWHTIALVVATVVVVSTIGFSRLYVGVHYLSDVLMGFVVGAVWIGVGAYVSRKYDTSWLVGALQSVQVRYPRAITLALVLLLVSVYVYMGIYQQPELVVR